MNKVSIWFSDNIWWPLFGKEEPAKIEMTGRQLATARVEFGLTVKQMAKMLCVSLEDYKKFEKNGLLAPHDTQGPSIRIIQVIRRIRKEISNYKDILDIFGYKGVV